MKSQQSSDGVENQQSSGGEDNPPSLLENKNSSENSLLVALSELKVYRRSYYSASVEKLDEYFDHLDESILKYIKDHGKEKELEECKTHVYNDDNEEIMKCVLPYPARTEDEKEDEDEDEDEEEEEEEEEEEDDDEEEEEEEDEVEVEETLKYLMNGDDDEEKLKYWRNRIKFEKWLQFMRNRTLRRDVGRALGHPKNPVGSSLYFEGYLGDHDRQNYYNQIQETNVISL